MPLTGTAKKFYPSTGYQWHDTSTSGTNETVWIRWNTVYTTSVTGITTTSSNNLVWDAWNTAYTQTIAYQDRMILTYDNNSVWSSWNENWRPSAAPVIHMNPHREPSPEERAQAEARDRAWREQEAEKQRVAAEARARANRLLLSVLDDTQKRDWAAHGHFYLYKGDKKYRIRKGRSGNVELVDANNEPLERYCAHPVDAVPDEDTVIAQMMMLLYDEARFIATANVHFTRQGFLGQKGRLQGAGENLHLAPVQIPQPMRRAA